MSTVPFAPDQQYPPMASLSANAPLQTQQPQNSATIPQQQPVTQSPLAAQNAAAQPTPSAGGRVKNLLSNFFYGMGQGMLHEVGLPTDYEKQQQALKMAQVQQNIDQQKQSLMSEIALRQQQTAASQQQNELIALPSEAAQDLGITHVPRADYEKTIGAWAQYKAYGNANGGGLGFTVTDPAQAKVLNVPVGTTLNKEQAKLAFQALAASRNGVAYQANGENATTGFANKYSQTYTPQTGPLTSGSYVGGVNRAIAMEQAKPLLVIDPSNPLNSIYVPAGQAEHGGMATPASIPYKTTGGVQKYFTSGAGGANLSMFNTAIDHGNALLQAATALQNGDIQGLNKAGNYIAQQTGSAAPVTFDTIKNAYVGEMSKTFKGGQATDAEIKSMENNFNRAQSPAQLRAAIMAGNALMTGKRNALKNQYARGMAAQPNFDNVPTQPDNPGSSGRPAWDLGMPK